MPHIPVASRQRRSKRFVLSGVPTRRAFLQNRVPEAIGGAIGGRGMVTVKLSGQTVIEHRIPDAATEHKLSNGTTWLPQGTFALQGHPPMAGKGSKACFRNIRVKVMPD